MSTTNAKQIINKPIVIEIEPTRRSILDDTDDSDDDYSDDSVEELNIDELDELNELIREEEETELDWNIYPDYAITDPDIYDNEEEITFSKIREYYWNYGDKFSKKICCFYREKTVESVKELFDLKKEQWEDYKQAVRNQNLN